MEDVKQKINDALAALEPLCVEYISQVNAANQAAKRGNPEKGKPANPNYAGQAPTAALNSVFASVVQRAAKLVAPDIYSKRTADGWEHTPKAAPELKPL